MSMPRDVPEPHARAPLASGLGSSDMILVAARQDRQRTEIHAKLNAMLAKLQPRAASRPAPSAAPRSDVPPVVIPQTMPPLAVARPVPGEAPPCEQPAKPVALATSAATLAATLDRLGEAKTPRHAPAAESVAAPSAPSEATTPERTAPAPSPAASDPSVRRQIDSLAERLDRMEAASVMAATTLDSLVSSFDEAQKATFAAAKAAAREEAGAVVTGEVMPAIAELNGAAAQSREEIHAVLSLLGTCLDRVVGHLQKLEALGEPADGAAAEPPLPFAVADLDFVPVSAPSQTVAEPPPVAIDPPSVLAEPVPTVPLPGLGRRSKFAALIDFRSGTRAA